MEVYRQESAPAGAFYQFQLRPRWTVRPGLSRAGSLWIAKSLKLGREVRFRRSIDRAHWLLIEADPEVASFCEEAVWAADGPGGSPLADLCVRRVQRRARVEAFGQKRQNARAVRRGSPRLAGFDRRPGRRRQAQPRAHRGDDRLPHGPAPGGAAGIATKIGCHTFRATGITEYLRNGGKLEVAQQMANHESARTTGLYDRRQDQVSLDEVERILI